MTEQIYIGVDLGGTSIKTGICDEHGKLIYKMEGPTEYEGGSQVVLDNIAKYVRKIVEDTSYHWDQVAGIGAGIAAFMDIPEGFVKLAPNLGWKNVPVKKILESKL